MNKAVLIETELPVVPLARDTLQDGIFRQLSDMILDGEIIPGQRVKIQELANAFGVSTMPVREALKRLTEANALTVISGRSIGIPPLSSERLKDLRRVRKQIEGITAEWAVDMIDDLAVVTLTRKLEDMKQAASKSDVKGYLRANRAFHFEIYQASGSKTMMAIIENLWLQISPYFNLLHESGNYAESNQEHEAILNAILDGNKPALRNAVHADIDGSFKVLLELLD